MDDRASSADHGIKFYVGLHQPGDAKYFKRCCISINRLRDRKRPITAGKVILDSGAFTELSLHGCYRQSVDDYVQEIQHVGTIMPIEVVVAQDYMCEAFILTKTGLAIADHQRLTIERYDRLTQHSLAVPILPVLQGYAPRDYVRHLEMYQGRLGSGQWVGVGSVCKRNGSPADIRNVLSAIKARRPDLRLHGFGIKRTALADPSIRAMLYSADSMAWSYSARKQGRNGNDWREALAFSQEIARKGSQGHDGWQASFDF
jgi:hypothetical protein